VIPSCYDNNKQPLCFSEKQLCTESGSTATCFGLWWSHIGAV